MADYIPLRHCDNARGIWSRSPLFENFLDSLRSERCQLQLPQQTTWEDIATPAIREPKITQSPPMKSKYEDQLMVHDGKATGSAVAFARNMDACNGTDEHVHLFSLPPEILTKILQYLDLVACLCFSLTTTGTYSLIKAHAKEGRLPSIPKNFTQKVNEPWGYFTRGTQFNKGVNPLEEWIRDRKLGMGLKHWVYVVEDRWDPRRLIKYIP